MTTDPLAMTGVQVAKNAAGVGKLATKSVYILEMSTYIFSVAYKGALRLQGE